MISGKYDYITKINNQEQYEAIEIALQISNSFASFQDRHIAKEEDRKIEQAQRKAVELFSLLDDLQMEGDLAEELEKFSQKKIEKHRKNRFVEKWVRGIVPLLEEAGFSKTVIQREIIPQLKRNAKSKDPS